MAVALLIRCCRVLQRGSCRKLGVSTPLADLRPAGYLLNPLTGKHANLRVGVVVESKDFYELSI